MADEAQADTGSTGGGVTNAAALIAGMRSEGLGSAPPAEAPAQGEGEQPAAAKAPVVDDREPDTEYQMPEADGDEPEEFEATDEAEADIPEVEEAEDDGPDEDPIALPATWTEAERQELSELPPDVQQAVVRREKEREAAFTSRQTEIAGDREQLDDAVRMAGDRWVNQLNNVDHLLASAMQLHGFSGQEPNWAELRQSMDRDQFDDARFNWEQNKRAFEGVMATAQQAKQQVEGLVGERLNEWIAGERVKTAERWPEFKVGRESAMAPLLEYLAEKGVSESQRNDLNDDAFISVVQDAANWHNLQKGKPGVNKRVRKAPKIGKAGAPASQGRRKRERVTQAKRNAHDTRSLAEVFSSMRD